MKNLRIAGFPEGVEGSDGIAFFRKMVTLDLPGTPEIERVHRMLWRKPPESGIPRAFVINFLHYTVRILEAAQKKRELLYGNSKIMTFLDLLYLPLYTRNKWLSAH